MRNPHRLALRLSVIRDNTHRITSSSYVVIPPCGGSGYDYSKPVVDSFTSSINGQEITATLVARDCGSLQPESSVLSVCYSELPGPVEICDNLVPYQSSTTNGNTTTFTWNLTIPAEWPCGTGYLSGTSNKFYISDNVGNTASVQYPADFNLPC